LNYWILTTEYPPFYGGGISTYCYHTACMITQKGHQVTVITNDNRIRSVEIAQVDGIRIVRFNPALTGITAYLGETTNLAYAFAMILKKMISEGERPDLIETQDYNGIAYFLLQFKACLTDWCKNIPIVVTMHAPSFLYIEYNQGPLYKNPNFWIGEMERFSIQAADLVISPSSYLIDQIMQRFTILSDNLRVIPNPYDVDSASYSVSTQTSEVNNKLAFYGKLSPQKGSFRILEEFKKLWDNGFNESFTMIGGEEIVFHPMKRTMGAIIREKYGFYIERGLLQLKNKISLTKQTNVLSEFDIFVIPSIVDNLPYVVMELMALGKIVIVSKQGGQSEIISDQEDGFIFDYTRPSHFEQVLAKVLQLDSHQRQGIIAKAKNKIFNRYSYDNIYQQKIKLLDELRMDKKQRSIFPLIRKLDENKINIPHSANQDLLSVIIPYYNLGNYLDETITSVLKSTYPSIEIIIVNDGSTDNKSIATLEKYRHFKNISIIDKTNTGLADSRNIGAQAAQGYFMAFLDADDTVESSYFTKAITLLKQYDNVHFVGCWTRYFGNSKAIWPTFNPEPPLLLTHNLINSSSLVYKTWAFLSSGKNDSDFKIGLEDYASVICMKSNGLNGVAIPELLFNYRVRKNSMIKNSNDTVRASYHKKMTEKYPKLFNSFQKEIQALNKENGLPLGLDNSTLDPLPFQNIPIVGTLVRKAIYLVKANPSLKNFVLELKNKVLSR
jgi:glycosyltransferase involved in cell wall biosynthesis